MPDPQWDPDAYPAQPTGPWLQQCRSGPRGDWVEGWELRSRFALTTQASDCGRRGMRALFGVAFCLLVSCTTFKSDGQRQIVGEWRYTDRVKSCRYVFERDGSFRGEVIYHGKLWSKFTGRWFVQGDSLMYRYMSDSLNHIPAGTTDRDKLLVVQGDAFTIEAADGSRRTYKRVGGGER